jgi:DNA-binding MarR family transcriptional regulator
VKVSAVKQAASEAEVYRLEEQVGYILRQASQRHAAIFAARIPGDLTATQFAALAKLAECGACSQNHLGRMTSMDGATIKGVTDRLVQRGYIEARLDPEDSRRRVLVLTPLGAEAAQSAIPAAFAITEETLEPLSPSERAAFLALLKKLR